MQNDGDFSVLDLFGEKSKDEKVEVKAEPKPQVLPDEEELDREQKKWLWNNSFRRIL